MGDPIPAHPTNAAMEELRAMVQTLAAEVQRLHAEVEDERKQRIYAVAALNQKMGKVLRRTSGGGGGSGGVASQEGDSPSSSRRGSSASNTAVAEAGTQQRDDASHSSQTPAPVKSALKKQKDPNVAALDPPQPAAAVVVADPKEEHLGVGSPVDVRCVSVLDNETEAKWDAARIMHVEGKGLYTVIFEDGEKWGGVPAADVRPSTTVQHVRTQPSSPVLTENADVRAVLAQDTAALSGYLWVHTNGWVSARERKWVVLENATLELFSSPIATTAERKVSLQDATLDATPAEVKEDGHHFAVTHASGAERFECASAEEWGAWTGQLRVVLFKGSGEKMDATFAAFYKELRGRPLRSVVPRLKEKDKPEEVLPTLWKRYIVSQSAVSWFSSGDWARRYATVHEGFLTLRADKLTTLRLVLIPLSEASLHTDAKDPENPYNIVITSPHLDDPVTLCPDSSEMYSELSSALTASFKMANPHRMESGLL